MTLPRHPDSIALNQRTDRLFTSDSPVGDFVFDARVAEVFEDMINRSVPGYRTIISMIGVLAARYCQPDSRVYDLGCSLGAATFAMGAQIPHQQYRLIAVDNSPAMMEGLAGRLANRPVGPPVELVQGDVREVEIQDASVVVLNFTLQFIPLADRDLLLQRIHAGMRPGGVLILSEKIRFPDPDTDRLFIDLHHRFKEDMGYSRLEISRKRAALENVLLPETIEAHRRRAVAAGFPHLDVWFQCFNFTSMVAFKTGAATAAG